ncbi:hypothetical protein FHT44_006224 [Mycolicibacterium sp. BK634]|uniref:sensor domain-containing protein n=1 Tax=Mycolicibacterium sp. BK634 TaxID=2587099 RepID=UPI00161D6EE4|nr:sensor domain-containing protein [Mycolicibacterium sp. BK634]MBB3753702.1 hypothetical protein [Mycolicibacterium sp. BK634]
MICSSISALAGLTVVAGTVGLASAGAAPVSAPTFWSNTQAGPEAGMADAVAVSAITGSPNIVVVGSSPRLTDTAARISPSDCLGAWRPGQQQAYAGRPWIATVTTVLADGKDADAQHIVQETVVQFGSPTDARRYLQDSAAQWEACAQRVVTVVPPSGASRPWRLGQPATAAGAPMTLSQVGPTSRCERALAAKADMVIDVLVCSSVDDPVGQGAVLIDAIATQSKS